MKYMIPRHYVHFFIGHGLLSGLGSQDRRGLNWVLHLPARNEPSLIHS
jgi:hypothetical protein